MGVVDATDAHSDREHHAATAQRFAFFVPRGCPPEAVLRKDSFLFCLGLLAGLNCLGQPILLIVSHWQNWQTAHRAIVVCCALILNATLLGTLPTLYASWNFRQLPKE